MASPSLTFPSLQLQFPTHTKSSKPSKHKLIVRPIFASVSEKPSVPVSQSQAEKSSSGPEPRNTSQPCSGPTCHPALSSPPTPKSSFYWMERVFLYSLTFPKLKKKDVFTGTFMPSTEFTGGFRVLSYLDPSEPDHTKLKRLLFFLLQSSRDRIIPEFHSCFSELSETLESELAAKGKASFADPNDQASFNFLARALYGTKPADTKLGTDGPGLITTWVVFQLSPILTLGLPKFIEEPLIHTFPLPAFLAKSSYQKLYDFFYDASTHVLDEGEKMGISREEACHNLLFATCFNSFGGMKIIFPTILKWVGRGGVKLHTQLAQEIRSVVKSNGGKVTMASMEQMPLMKSTVYEAFRIEPPVALQYGKAKQDLVIESHDSVFEVKEGEMLFGYQPFATKDPKIFERSEEFVPDRFVGEGEKLLKHVLWSNGPETENPTLGNKQCAGKDFVVLAARLFVVELFLRYDSFDIEVGTSLLGSAINLTSLKRASF
ncbi:Allene oxide synthase 1, chloroplastic [Vitis vinifera]|uniref:Allene oxide synthase 1, chloroplastic n=1 Tax=Vitis vinifera TaxID=29760 RepID=A0A438K195_VITVI|nr:Allene oxide synthase 1, chloroplastic [Vitis vinifera]